MQHQHGCCQQSSQLRAAGAAGCMLMSTTSKVCQRHAEHTRCSKADKLAAGVTRAPTDPAANLPACSSHKTLLQTQSDFALPHMQLQDCSPTSNLPAKHTKQLPYSQANFLGQQQAYTRTPASILPHHHTHLLPLRSHTRHRQPGTGSCVQRHHNTSLAIHLPPPTDHEPASHQGASSRTHRSM